VAKDSSKGKNTDNIDTYPDTSYLFPKVLKNKKVQKNEEKYEESQTLKKYYDTLQYYIDSEDLKLMIKALNIDNQTIFKGLDKYLKYCYKINGKYIERDLITFKLQYQFEQLLKDVKQLPDYFIIWCTIDNLLRHFNPANNELGNPQLESLNYEIQKYLNRISPLILIDHKKKHTSNTACNVKTNIDENGVKKYEKILPEDGLEHHKYHSKSGLILKFYADNPKTFLDYFKNIKNIVSSSFYKTTNPYKKKDLISKELKSKGINFFDDEFEEDALRDINKTTANIIASLHSSRCGVSVNQNISYKTIYNLYKVAEKTFN